MKHERGFEARAEPAHHDRLLRHRGTTAAWLLIGCVLIAVGTFGARLAAACPFCDAASLTFCEEIDNADAVVVARLVTPAPAAIGATELGKARFKVVDRLKGDKSWSVGKQLEVFYFGSSPVGSLMLITGVDPADVNWQTPIPISEKAHEYLRRAIELPAEGPDRMVFFQNYLEDPDELLALDAYAEFAKTSYTGVKELRDRIDHDKLIGWIQDPKVVASHRRLYLCMLGVCGQKQDVALLEAMLRSDDRQVRAGLDSLVAAYLTLKGPDGMPLIEDKFLKNQNSADSYSDTYAAIMALRFHGQEETIIPRPRLLEALHYVLDDPQLADLVIADLARWKDWGAMDRLVELFKNSTDNNEWVRVPVINYLQACPLPEAKERLAELAKIDPDSFRKATTLFAISTPPAPPEASPADGLGTGGLGTGSAAANNSDSGEPDASGQADAVTVAADDASPAQTPSGDLVSAGPPAAAEAAPTGIASLLIWMALVGGAVGIAVWVVLGGSRKAA